ncbi:MAG: AAA family ATPase, partial [Promethearchaeota archaeon]
MKKGDYIIIKRGLDTILGFARITSEYKYNKERGKYKNVRNIEFIRKGEWKTDFKMTMKTLTNKTKDKKFINKTLVLMGLNPEDFINSLNIQGDGREEAKITKNFWLVFSGIKGQEWENWREEGKIAIDFDKLGDLKQYKNRKEIKDRIKELYNLKNPKVVSLACWQFCNEIKIGDYVIVKTSVNKVLGFGEVISDYEFDNSRKKYKHIREVKYIKTGEWIYSKRFTPKALTNITKDKAFLKELSKLMGIDFWKESIRSIKQVESEIDKIKEELIKKCNLILYGPPGTGKTYLVNRLKINWEREFGESSVVFVTFHQSYGYEEFVEGIKPDVDSNENELMYELRDGVFKKIVKEARRNYERSTSQGEFDINELIDDYFEYVNDKLINGEKVLLRKNVTIEEVFTYSDGTYKGFLLGGSLKSKPTLSRRILERDLKNFLDGKIRSYRDIKPRYKSLSESIGNAIYYWSLFENIKKFYESKKEEYKFRKEELKKYLVIIDEINRGNIS